VLAGLRARAIETSRPEWIREQDARGIADLDRAQWDRVIRMIGAFEPIEDEQNVPSKRARKSRGGYARVRS
jgi:hypothetical protein